MIFKKKVYDFGWSLDDSITVKFFEENFNHFKFFGGDMEILFSRCKRSHSRRIFASKDNTKKVLNITDLKRGLESFINHRNHQKPKESEAWKNIYI